MLTTFLTSHSLLPQLAVLVPSPLSLFVFSWGLPETELLPWVFTSKPLHALWPVGLDPLLLLFQLLLLWLRWAHLYASQLILISFTSAAIHLGLSYLEIYDCYSHPTSSHSLDMANHCLSSWTTCPLFLCPITRSFSLLFTWTTQQHDWPCCFWSFWSLPLWFSSTIINLIIMLCLKNP